MSGFQNEKKNIILLYHQRSRYIFERNGKDTMIQTIRTSGPMLIPIPSVFPFLIYFMTPRTFPYSLLLYREENT